MGWFLIPGSNHIKSFCLVFGISTADIYTCVAPGCLHFHLSCATGGRKLNPNNLNLSHRRHLGVPFSYAMFCCSLDREGEVVKKINKER